MWKCRLVKFCLVFVSSLVIVACSTSEHRLVKNKCSTCHPYDVVTVHRYSENQWKNTVDAMVVRGLKVNDVEKDIIVKYLAKHYPPK